MTFILLPLPHTVLLIGLVKLQCFLTGAVAGMWTLKIPFIFVWLSAVRHVIHRVDSEVGTDPAP